MTALKLDKPCEIKIEDLDMNRPLAERYIQVMHDFLTDLNFDVDRIEGVNCRRYSGFIPFSHNKGGLEARCYRDQFSAQMENTGFTNTDNILNRYQDNDLADFLSDNNIQVNEFDDSVEWQEKFDEYRQRDDATVEFMARIMMTSDTTATVSFYVSASDTPYHRTADDELEIEIKFKTPEGMKRKLKSIMNEHFVRCFKSNVRSAW